jgi:acetyltransferase EpsM
MAPELIIIGASDFGREVLWVCRRAGLVVAGFCDDAPEKQAGTFCGLPLFGRMESAGRGDRVTGFQVAVGDNRARQAIARRAQQLGWQPVAVCDPSAMVAPDATLAPGAYVGIGSVVSCQAQVGFFALVNHHVTLGHDAVVGACAQLCPGVRVSGRCEIGEGALLGSNAVLLPGRRLGAWSVLGAGAVGVTDLAPGASVVRVR